MLVHVVYITFYPRFFFFFWTLISLKVHVAHRNIFSLSHTFLCNIKHLVLTYFLLPLSSHPVFLLFFFLPFWPFSFAFLFSSFAKLFHSNERRYFYRKNNARLDRFELNVNWGGHRDFDVSLIFHNTWLGGGEGIRWRKLFEGIELLSVMMYRKSSDL